MSSRARTRAASRHADRQAVNPEALACAATKGGSRPGAAAADAALAVNAARLKRTRVEAAAAPEDDGGSATHAGVPGLDEDEFCCSICWDLLLDPVVAACGHDYCELCLQRWLVDQGRRTCPACRAALPAEPPAVCLRLQRTLQSLFPQRTKQRQADVAQQRAALAQAKRAAEAERRAAAQRQAAALHEHDRMMQAVLGQLLRERPDWRAPAQFAAPAPAAQLPEGAPLGPTALLRQRQQQQQVDASPLAPDGHLRAAIERATAASDAALAALRHQAVADAAGLGGGGDGAQLAGAGWVGGVLGGLRPLLSSLLRGAQQPAASPPAAQQQPQTPAGVTAPQGQAAPALDAGRPQLQPHDAPAPSPQQQQQGDPWDAAPPLHDMTFSVGWHSGQPRRRRFGRGGR